MISWFQIQTWQVRGGSNPIRPFFDHFWRGWTSIDHHRSKMIEAIEAIEAILTWTGYSPRAVDSSPGAGFGGSASGGSCAHADCATDGHGSPSSDGCAERASCATHQTKGHPAGRQMVKSTFYMEMEMGWKLIVGRCWEGEDQLDIII